MFFPLCSKNGAFLIHTVCHNRGMKREAQIDMTHSEQKTLQGYDITLDLITTEAYHMTSVLILSSRLTLALQHGVSFKQ